MCSIERWMIIVAVATVTEGITITLSGWLL